MKYIMEKISSYNIVNYLVPGIIFVTLCVQFKLFTFDRESMVLALFRCYFIGLLLSRIASLVIEPILKRLDFIKFVPLENYVDATRVDPKIEILSEQNNMYRTLCSLCVMLIVLLICNGFIREYALPWVDFVKGVLFLISLLVLFLFSYRKQTRYIVRRVEIALTLRKE